MKTLFTILLGIAILGGILGLFISDVMLAIGMGMAVIWALCLIAVQLNETNDKLDKHYEVQRRLLQIEQQRQRMSRKK